MALLRYSFNLKLLAVLLLAVLLPSRYTVTAQPAPLRGQTTAVYDLLDRVLPPGGRNHFILKIEDAEQGENAPFFQFATDDEGHLRVTASSASELSAGIGWYLRHFCNMTIGWPRGGGSRTFLPAPNEWPVVNSTAFEYDDARQYTRHRKVAWSYLMNVCTHSYSLVWYNWADWEQFIDWMSLSGINLMLALTGQEEVQYKVFRKFGLSDDDIRSWFNGPAFLTWSRGQNEYGNKICGPLPRSWMEDQWEMQRSNILPRLRELGITGQLPGFQGNVPIQLKELYKDANITQQGDTGWMDSLDPLYGEIADVWMETLIGDFGTDHWYQLDGYFNGGTAPWMSLSSSSSSFQSDEMTDLRLELQRDFQNVPHDKTWFQRGVAAYQGLNRTDPDAVWSFQGFSFVGWSTREQASFIKGFVDSAPKGKFVVIDMGYGDGEWRQWNNASFFDAPFVWSALRSFGGSNGMKGDLEHVNRMPHDALSGTSIFGSGATPEGINNDPVYYEFLFDHVFHERPIENMHSHIIQRSHRRYGLVDLNTNVAEAWSLLVDSSYSQDFGVYDTTGIIHLKSSERADTGMFENDRCTPKPILCKIFQAWANLLDAADTMKALDAKQSEPFRYDLINLGREVLAQLATPASLNISDVTNRQILDAQEIRAAGTFYVELLDDTDKLVGTDPAFLLGPWIESARQWGKLSTDCPTTTAVLNNTDCQHFYEWNARTQLTTWNPTPRGSPSIPGGPIDYAGKHWSGLIKDYYAKRAMLLMEQALSDEGAPLNQTKVSRIFAQHAYEWTTAVNKYPVTTTGDFLKVSRAMFVKYKDWFSSCGAGTRRHAPLNDDLGRADSIV